MITTLRNPAASLVVILTLRSFVDRLFAHRRKLLLAVSRANSFYTGFKTVSLIRLFERIDVVAHLNFGRRDSDVGSHVGSRPRPNGLEILA